MQEGGYGERLELGWEPGRGGEDGYRVAVAFDLGALRGVEKVWMCSWRE